MKPEPEKPLIPKRPKDARDAREIAKKLIKSGNINIQKQESQVQFKRPKGQERKKLLSEPATTYHPFSTPSIDDEAVSSASLKSPTEKSDSVRPIPVLYQTFEKEKDTGDKKSNFPVKEKPKTGFTIFVQGKGVTEDSLKKNFNDYGNIVNVSMEIEKNRGFVTFSKTEATERAIAEVRRK